MIRDNIILRTDSYKWTHPSMYRPDTQGLFAYLSARQGGENAWTLWHGLQAIIKKYLEGPRVTPDVLAEAESVDAWHFAKPQLAVAGWQRVIDVHGGRLPLRISAAPEGSVVPTGCPLMTVESTDPQLPWLVGAVEGLLEKVWYPMAVATKSFKTRIALQQLVVATGGSDASYLLHDFGYRACTSEEQAEIGACAHLLSFNGTDTMTGMIHARDYYAARTGMAHSVAAAEHSTMTADGREGEIALALHIIASHPNQIVSLVADSYDYYRFVDAMIANKEIVDRYKVKLVIRPDSTTPLHQTPKDLVLWTLQRIEAGLGATQTPTGHKLLPYGVLWGDGLGEHSILAIARAAKEAGYAVQNLVFGMGGGLLQKVDRDTNRVAYKVSARMVDGAWLPMAKEPLDVSKRSAPGRLALAHVNGVYETRPYGYGGNVIQPIFEDGLVLRQDRFEDIRARVTEELLARVASPVGV